jgi:Uma2 family endonuclease
MSAIEKQTWTVEQYLEMERASEEKHEYLNGEIYLMAGGTGNHNAINMNTGGSLVTQLRKTPCITYSSDQRVHITATGLYTYPDITVVCDPPLWRDNRRDTLLNPTLIVEVLSPSTENYDRTKKFRHYRTLASLKEYVLISQDEPRIERYLRQPNDEWLFTEIIGLDMVLELPSIQCSLALTDVYDKINFEESERE